MKKTPIIIAIVIVVVGIILVAYFTQLGGNGQAWDITATTTSATSTASTSTESAAHPGASGSSAAAARATYMNASSNDITIASPTAGATVGTTFSVNGKARGNWFFEASFPIEVISKDGAILYQHPAAAGADWQTTDFVPFTASMTISDYTGPATLVLLKDNPSGNPENDASVKIPIDIENTTDVPTVVTPIGN